MPNKNVVPFIDKKKSVSFKLVHRSQQDPLVTDESAPQRVLLQIKNKNGKKKSSSEIQQDGSPNYKVLFDNEYSYLECLTDTCALNTDREIDKRKISTSSIPFEQRNHKITLPSSVFESNIEEKVGLLNKAAPVSNLQLHLDSDIVAALDDDFAFDDPNNELEDNFIELANENYVVDGNDEETFCKNGVNLTSECLFSTEETKSKFTEYSLSSSIMKRSKQLSILDDKFEKLYADYDDHVLGSSACEDIEDNMHTDSKAPLQINDIFIKEENEVEYAVKLMNKTMNLKTDRQAISSDGCNTEHKKLVVLPSIKNKWDCNSILSIYNKNQNRPKFIDELRDFDAINIDAKTDIPKGSMLLCESVSTGNLFDFGVANDFSKAKNAPKICTMNKSPTIRLKNESLLEKKHRKQVIKNERQERRKERKMNILAFKGEEQIQKKIMFNNNQNIQGSRIL